MSEDHDGSVPPPTDPDACARQAAGELGVSYTAELREIGKAAWQKIADHGGSVPL